MNQKNLVCHIWNVAELLRGNFKQSEYGAIVLPFTVLRRLECVLEPTSDAVADTLSALVDYVASLSPNLRKIFEHLGFDCQATRLDSTNSNNQ